MDTSDETSLTWTPCPATPAPASPLALVSWYDLSRYRTRQDESFARVWRMGKRWASESGHVFFCVGFLLGFLCRLWWKILEASVRGERCPAITKSTERERGRLGQNARKCDFILKQFSSTFNAWIDFDGSWWTVHFSTLTFQYTFDILSCRSMVWWWNVATATWGSHWFASNTPQQWGQENQEPSNKYKPRPPHGCCHVSVACHFSCEPVVSPSFSETLDCSALSTRFVKWTWFQCCFCRGRRSKAAQTPAKYGNNRVPPAIPFPEDVCEHPDILTLKTHENRVACEQFSHQEKP